MKKCFALLTAIFLLLSLAACSTSSPNITEPHSTTTPQVSATAKPTDTPTATKEPDPTKEPSKMDYEVTYSNAKTWVNSIGTTWVQTIVEITNTGNVDLYLDSGSYDLEDSTGALVAAKSLVSTYPNVLAPGEKGYMYDETTLDDYKGDGELTVIPRPSVKEAKVDLIRYNITDVSVSDKSFGDIGVKGRVENVSDKSSSMVYIVAFFYDESDVMIGSAFTIMMEELNPGDKVGFEFSSFSMPSDITSDMITETVVYAYPLQYQF